MTATAIMPMAFTNKTRRPCSKTNRMQMSSQSQSQSSRRPMRVRFRSGWGALCHRTDAEHAPVVEAANIPPGTATTELTLVDQSKNNLLHWRVLRREDTKEKTTYENYQRWRGYDPPCPPEGSGPHTYVLTLTARAGRDQQSRVLDVATYVFTAGAQTATAGGGTCRVRP